MKSDRVKSRLHWSNPKVWLDLGLLDSSILISRSLNWKDPPANKASAQLSTPLSLEH